DRQARLASVPARVGVQSALRLAVLCHVLMVGLLLAFYWVADMGAIYLLGLFAVAVLLAYEHWLVRPDGLSQVNRAFFHVNGVISLGLFLVVLLQLAVK